MMPPAVALRHPASQFPYRSVPVPDWVTLFRHRTYSGIGISLFLSVQNWPDAGRYGISPFVKLYEGGKGSILHVHTRLLLVLQLKNTSKYRNAGEKS
jgi:hypothetical protein